MHSNLDLKQRKKELLDYLEKAREYKSRTIKFVHDLEHQLHSKKISQNEFHYRLNKALRGKSLHDWVNYYNDLIHQANHELNLLHHEINKTEKTKTFNLSLLIILGLILASITSLILFKPSLTGFAVYEPESIIKDLVTLSINQNITIENATVTAKLNEQEKSLPLNEFEVIENLANINLEKFEIKAEEGTLFVLILYENEIIAETSLDISLKEIGPINGTIPPSLTNITNQTITQGNISITSNISSDLDKIKLRLSSQNIKVKDIKRLNDKYKLNLEVNESSLEINGLDNIDNLREIKVEKTRDNKIRRGFINTKIIAVRNIIIENATIILQKYGKVNTILKCDNFDLDAFLCNNWITTNLPFFDNGSSITFTVNSFSAYAGAYIEITKAEHLDSNRGFLSDIYNEVKNLDNIWSEEIPNGDYVRVTFERELSSDNDITLYPRIISGNPKIEVYEADGTNWIAKFTAINNNSYNKVFLTNLNGSLELDHIIDPEDTDTPMINFTNPTPVNATLFNQTNFMGNPINITLNLTNLDTFVFNWNTTNFTIYNDSIIFMLNFNNITEIGEGAFNKTRAVDVSNYSNNFTCINAGVSCNWTTSGKHNGGIGFDADDILVMIRQNDDVNAHIPNDGEPFTISFWVKKNSTSNAVLFGASNFPTTGFDIEDDGASSVTFFVFPEGTGGCGTAGNPCFSRSLINDNIWHNVVGVYDPAGSAMKLYLDGVQRDSQTANSSSYQKMDNGMLTFGVFNEGGGYMDEAIMWNIPLTAQQINQSYYSNLYKYQTDTWNYITNQTVNVNGTYTYLGYAKDTSGNSNMTETRTLIVNTSFVQAASVNSIPNNVSSLKINSTFSLQTNLTTENLQVRFNVSDPNAGDTLNYSIQWFRNNITNFTLTNIAVSNPGTGIETLQHQNTTKGDLWSAQVLVCDNSNACNSFINTSQLLILNAIPNVTSNLQPLNNTLVRTLTPNLNWTNSSDLDSDALYYLLDISNVSDFSNIIYNGKDTYVNYTGSPGLDGGFSGTMAASLDPRGITTNGSDFWILDPSTKYIYHFNSTGGNITGTPGLYGGFSLSVVATVINAQFITSNGSDFWISNSDPDYVYHINANGINMSDGFDLRSAYFSINPTGITTNGSDFWVVDSGSGFFIYHFNSTGGNLTDGYNLIKAYSPEASPRGITTNGSDFWFTDNSRDFVYHFDYYGNNITDGFSTISAYSSDTINTWGIETNKRLNHGNLKSPSDFWITDPNANYVYHFKGAVNEQGIQGNITQHNVTVALQDNTNYYWRIKAFDGSQESNYVYGNFTISTPNIAPNFTQGYPQINSTDGLNQSSKNLRVMILATDNDTSDRTLRYNLTVFTNNITNFTLNNIYYISGALQLENIQSANLTKGQTWKAMINLFDNDTNIISNTSELLILNNASTITQPAFNQTNYNIYHIISASLVVTDVDSDLSNVTFEWFKNNAIIRRTTTNNLNNGTNTSDILTPSNFGQNDNIIVQAFAFDGTINSTLINSTTITIQGINNASIFTQGYPQINSTDGLNKTNMNLTVIWIATDGQNSSLKYNITWFTNNLSNINLTNLDYTSNTLKVDILDFRNLTKGQSWKAMITVHDGEFNTYANTSELLILNSVPSIPLLNYPINDTYLSNSTPEFLINNSDDIDNNQVYYIL